MARPLRLEVPGALHHVMSRGNDGIPLYREDTDREQFLEFLARAIKRFRWVLHDYALMTNHFHLAIETPECTLSDGMHWLLGCYGQWFNRRHRRRGHLFHLFHLFHVRFKNVLVEKESYLLTLSRYIVLNPVKAGMVERAGPTQRLRVKDPSLDARDDSLDGRSDEFRGKNIGIRMLGHGWGDFSRFMGGRYSRGAEG